MAIDPSAFDWIGLARRISAGESGGIEVGRRAITELLGEPFLAAAVDFCIGYPDGFLLAQSVLDVLQPEVGRRRCIEIYKTEDEPPWRRQGAVELLATIGDRSTLPWIGTFLRDKDETIQGLGVAILDQLIWKERIEPDEGEEFIRFAETNELTYMRSTAHRIREYVKTRAELRKEAERP